ncbi:MAG TPA: alpha/beta family hydrolase [Chloroflexota bacterium]
MAIRPRPDEHDVEVVAENVRLPGVLGLPRSARGIVVFAHGSGSGRNSPRNNSVARVLQDAGLATLLVDLLMEQEAEDRRRVFDIPLLASRLEGATEWLDRSPTTRSLPVGYFGASTGAGAALVAASRRAPTIRGVVSRGGRPDLAESFLSQVRAPTLLIVGGYDTQVIDFNEKALYLLQCEKQLVIVPGATHLFEEAGTLERVGDLARDWFMRHLPV